MTKWRASALLGASAAALVIGLLPFSRGPEREVFSRIADRPPSSRGPRTLVADKAGRSALVGRRGLRRRRAGQLAAAMQAPASGGAHATGGRNLEQEISTLIRRGIDAAHDVAVAPAVRAGAANRASSVRIRLFAGPAGRPLAKRAATAGSPPRSGGAGLPKRRRRRAFGSRGGGRRSGRAPRPGVGGLARRPSSELQRARGFRKVASDLAGTGLCTLPRGGRTPRSSAVPLGGGGVLFRGAAAVERRKARRRARGGGDGTHRQGDPDGSRVVARRQFRLLDRERDPARLRRRAVEVGPQVPRRPPALRRKLRRRLSCGRAGRPGRNGARSGARRRRARTARPGVAESRARVSQERSRPSVRPHPGRAAREPRL